MKMPGIEEQRIVEEYVLERVLDRPDTNVRKVIVSICLFFSLTFVISLAFFCLSQRLGIFELFPEEVKCFQESNPKLFVFLYFVMMYLFSAICFAKKAAIGTIKLYQHYAPEEIRRRCLFKPTCSEYAILAIQKYGLIVGLIKTYFRLFKRCKGNIYMIDYP